MDPNTTGLPGSAATIRRPSIAATGWNAVLVVIIGASLITQTVLVIIGGVDVNSGAGTAALPLGTRLVNLFSFFTIQSNILVLIGAIRLLIDPGLRGTSWRVVRLDGQLGIVITGLVYVIVLRPLSNPTGIHFWVNAGLHYVAPPAAFLGWLILGPRPRISWRVLILSLGWPVAWIVYTLIRGVITNWYPYPFLDAGTLGWPIALRNIGVIVLIALALLMIMKALDRLPTAGNNPTTG
ncbi:MAG TPA: Pr6Pr family membrane protein [Microlunatus sp.]